MSDLALPWATSTGAAGAACLAALPIPDLTKYLPWILFGVLALLTLGSAILAAVARRIVHAAFGLMSTLLGVAGLYALLGADFLALAQVLVYVGGILVLLVFGVLLTSRVRGTLGMDHAPAIWPAVLAGTLLFLGLCAAIRGSAFPGRDTGPLPAEPTTAPLGRALLDPEQYLVPFELVSVLLLGALLGAAYLARRRRA